MAFDIPSAGELRHNLRFERKTPGSNIGGVKTTGWEVLVDTRRAKVAPTRGGADVVAGRLAGKVVYDIWISNDGATRELTVADRAVDNRTGEIYALGSPIDPNQRRQWLLIQAVSNGKVETP